MELYIMDKNFVKQDVIENFHSLIWTDRYYGDSECELVVPLTSDLIGKLTQKQATFLGIDKSKEPMIIETSNIEEGRLKIKGISICSWLNNRFIRTSNNHKPKIWKIKNQRWAQILSTIVRQMCTSESTYLTGSTLIGIPNARKAELIIPGLHVGTYDNTGKVVKSIKVAYGPVYDELRRIAEIDKIGMQITLVSQQPLLLEFRSYRGVDRTSGLQGVPPLIRFSIDMDSFTDVKELRSNAELKTVVYSYAPGLSYSGDTGNVESPGIARRTDASYTGFDLRAKIVFADDITLQDITDAGALPEQKTEAAELLETAAEGELKKNKYIQNVDGEISPLNQFQCGVDYNLGDLIEVQGPTGAIEKSRVIEYIRIHDENGERAYPTVEAVEA